MANTRNVDFTFSYETLPASSQQTSEIHLIIKRPQTHQSDIVIRIPYKARPSSHSLASSLEFLLTYHDIQEHDSRRMTERFMCFMNAVEVSTGSQTGMATLMFFKVTDNNFNAMSRIDTDILIGDLERTKREATAEEENEECVICLETFQGREDVNTLACYHIYHHECIVNWLYTKKNCPVCRAKDI